MEIRITAVLWYCRCSSNLWSFGWICIILCLAFNYIVIIKSINSHLKTNVFKLFEWPINESKDNEKYQCKIDEFKNEQTIILVFHVSFDANYFNFFPLYFIISSANLSWHLRYVTLFKELNKFEMRKTAQTLNHIKVDEQYLF